MSVCLCSFRALSRSRTPNAKTLTPFLYQTATIQQRNPISRRNASNPPRYPDAEHDIPFEGEELPPTVDEARARRKTTITGSERAAFESLYKKFNPTVKQHDHEPETADEYYEDDEDANDKSAQSLDSLFDNVLSNKPNPNAPLRQRRNKRPTDLESLARDLLKPEQDQARERKKKEAAAKQMRIKLIRNTEKNRVKALVEAAQTDQALWAILEKEVFSVIRNMDLDASPSSAIFGTKSKRKPKHGGAQSPLPGAVSKHGDPAPTDPIIVFPNYPNHLITAAFTLRANFPASSLPFTILPTLKSLGRSSYALGATTSLYKILIRAAWYQNHSYMQICGLLQDMDNGGIEYDDEIAALLDTIIKTHRYAQRAQFGKGMQAVMRLELFADGVKRLEAWQVAIKKRLGLWSEERKATGQLVRRTGWREVGRGGPEDNIRIKEVGVELGAEHAGRDVLFVRDSVQVESEVVGSSPQVESFLVDTLDAPVEAEAPLEPPVEATVPPLEGETEKHTQTHTPMERTPATTAGKETEVRLAGSVE